MSILAWVVIGLLAGWIANMFMRSEAGGLMADLLLGIFGAIVGGFVVGLFTGTDYTTGLNIPVIVASVIGAIILIGGYRLLGSKKIRT